jgi:hypothetical protein
MSYEAADRVLSLSFNRDPVEHADVMLATGRRMMTSTRPSSGGAGLVIAIGFGAVVGIAMEIHRRFLLPLIVGPSEIAPLGTVALQLLPLIILILALYAFLYVRALRRQRNALVSRLEPNVFVDVDIFPEGIRLSSDQMRIELDWLAVRAVFADGSRIEIECESIALYLPERAFTDRKAFAEAAKTIRNLWREALKREHDGKMVAAGLD